MRFYRGCPGFVFPSRGMFVCSFLTALLAGETLQWVHQKLAGNKTALILTGLLLAGCLGELGWFANSINLTVPVSGYRQQSEITEFLQQNTSEPGRVVTLHLVLSDFEAWTAEIEKLQGYEPVPLTRTAVAFEGFGLDKKEVASFMQGFKTFSLLRLRADMLDAYNVRYLVIPTRRKLNLPGWKEIKQGRVSPVVIQQGEESASLPYRIYENPDAMPRAYIVGHARTLEDLEKNVQQLQAMDLRQEVLLLQDVLPADQPRETFRSAEIQEYTPNKVVIQASLEKSGYLVLSDTWAPGWQAVVDGPTGCGPPGQPGLSGHTAAAG